MAKTLRREWYNVPRSQDTVYRIRPIGDVHIGARATRLTTAFEKQAEILPAIWFVLAKYGLESPAAVDQMIGSIEEVKRG